MNGSYWFQILIVDLSSLSFEARQISEELYYNFIGGRGLGAALLYNLSSPRSAPLSEANPLIFAAGSLEGTPVPTASRYSVATKSPLTGIYCYSMAGGFWGPELKKTGYDALIVIGKAKRPVYLFITANSVEFRDASPHWGKTTSETQAAIKNELGLPGVRTVCIGPAGENQVKFAAILSEQRAAGRGGCGAVMGFKNLKAIAIYGEKSIAIFNREELQIAIKEAYRAYRSHPFSAQYLPNLGTPGNTSTIQKFKMLPTKNYRYSSFPGWENISAERLNSEHVIKKRALTCYKCPMQCSRLSKSKKDFGEFVTEGPDYETIWAFGPNCGHNDLSDIIYFEYLCDELGLDTMSTGSTIGFLLECLEKNICSGEQFGNPQTNYTGWVNEVISSIVQRKGMGDLLAEGTRTAARVLGNGAEHLAMHVKGLELGGYDPRGAKGLGLVYATGNRGGCHHASGYILPDEWKQPETLLDIKNKAEMVRLNRNNRIIFDSAILCTHSIAPVGPELLGKIIYAASGLRFDTEALATAAERINCLERLYNVREGISRKDDTLPKRILEDGTEELPPFGYESFTQLLDSYYEISCWDKEGIPTAECIAKLGLLQFLKLRKSGGVLVNEY